MPATRRSLWDVLTRRSTHAVTATEVYGRLVAAARQPAFYTSAGAPDTPEGRLEVLVLHVVLMLRRLSREGEPPASLSRAISETFVVDMDDCLREMGVSDIGVARKVKKVAAALFDRTRDYGAALDSKDRSALARLLAVHVLSADAPDARADRLATYALETEAAFDRASFAELTSGQITYPQID